MPKLKDGHFRKTQDGYWQVRYRRDGHDIQFTSKSKQVVIDRFREWVKGINEEKKPPLPKKQQLFSEFAVRYFQEVKRVNVSEGTYQTQLRCLELHILPVLGSIPLRQITPIKCQSLLNAILSEGKGRTAEAAKFILGEIFRAAIGEKLISESPMSFVKIPKHVRENGRALTVEEVRSFLKAIETSPYRKQYMIFLYTGIRRNELHELRIEGNFISVVCGKCRKGQKPRRRLIPIHSELRPFLPLSEEELDVKNDVLTGNFKKICPDHHLYDLRHTFITRSIECSISKSAVDLWTDHVDRKDMTSSVYTHHSEEYQISEIEKLRF